MYRPRFCVLYMYSSKAAKLIQGDTYDNDIVTEHDVEIHHTSLAFYGYAHFRWSRELYIEVTWN